MYLWYRPVSNRPLPTSGLSAAAAIKAAKPIGGVGLYVDFPVTSNGNRMSTFAVLLLVAVLCLHVSAANGTGQYLYKLSYSLTGYTAR